MILLCLGAVPKLSSELHITYHISHIALLSHFTICKSNNFQIQCSVSRQGCRFGAFTSPKYTVRKHRYYERCFVPSTRFGRGAVAIRGDPKAMGSCTSICELPDRQPNIGGLLTNQRRDSMICTANSFTIHCSWSRLGCRFGALTSPVQAVRKHRYYERCFVP
jgi:hypothetical protein